MFDRTYHRTRKISLTPMIDMVFLLLIFFMLTTNFQHHKALNFSFGKSDAAPSTSKEPAIILITARNDGQIAVDDKLLSPKKFHRYMQEAITNQQNSYIIALKADHHATVQHMIWTIDQIHLVGASNITIINNPIKPQEGGE